MSIDQSSYPNYLWNSEFAHNVGDCPAPGSCDNGHEVAVR